MYTRLTVTKGEKKTRAIEPQGRDAEAVGRFVEQFALILSEAGFPRMPARVFVGLLIADGGSRTASELAELLQVSPAAISGAVRYLTQVKLAARERAPGTRSDAYRVQDDRWYEAFARRDEMLARWEQSLREGVATLGADTPAGERLEETRLFFAFLGEELPRLMQKWREVRGAALTPPAPSSTPEISPPAPSGTNKRRAGRR